MDVLILYWTKWRKGETMAKAVKYEMYINTMETSGMIIPLSKKEFNRQIKYYKDAIAKNHRDYKEDIEEIKDRYPSNWRYDDIEHCLNDIDIQTEEYEKYIETVYAIHDNGTAIVFRERACKPGYHWR